MGDVGCSPGGMGSTGEDRRNRSSSLVKLDTVGDGSGATLLNQIGLLEISTRLSNLIYPASSTGFTSDRYIRTLTILTLNSEEATCAFRSGPSEYRRKLGE